jgi:chloramphenicol-sensitive protein RarD
MSFALYGLLKKTVAIGSLVGLTVETLALAPFALAYLAFLSRTGRATAAGPAMQAVLALSGVVTSVPLLFFAMAARRLRLSTLGFVQYLTPSLQFLLAVFAFGEPFSTGQLASFACIWAAVVVYVFDSLRASRQVRLEVVEPD